MVAVVDDLDHASELLARELVHVVAQLFRVYSLGFESGSLRSVHLSRHKWPGTFPQLSRILVLSSQGLWFMVYGLWFMVYGVWLMVDG